MIAKKHRQFIKIYFRHNKIVAMLKDCGKLFFWNKNMNLAISNFNS